MFSESALYYDAIYSAAGKDYAAESQRIVALAHAHQRSPGMALLDVGCGTGSHLAHLRESFQVEGLELDPGLLLVARQKLPGVPLHQGDMVDFDLGRKFDVVLCLFGAIGYVVTGDRLRAAVANLRRHALPGGLIVIEPWLSPAAYRPGTAHAVLVDQPELKVARMNVSEVEGDTVSVLDFHYLAATPRGVRHFTEQHRLGLFTDEEYSTALAACGLEVRRDEAGLNGRGLYLGLVPGPQHNGP